MAKVLIIEDDKMLLNMYELKLKNAGIEVITAADGALGLEKAKNEKPDLILLDVILPKMDGFRVLKAIKEGEAIKNTPVLMITNLGQEEDMRKGNALGANGYLIKANTPPQVLVEEINKSLA